MSNRIIIDVGHGTDTYNLGHGKGTIKSNGEIFEENTFNSKVSLAIEKLLISNGFEVDYAQKPFKRDISLLARSNYINSMHKVKPYLCLLSIHANASSRKSANGWGVFHWHNSNLGLKLAKLWAKYAGELLDIPFWGSTGIWRCVPGTWSNFWIVGKTTPIAILIEHFFYTNSVELEKCTTDDYIKLFAEVTVRAICDYADVEYKSQKSASQKTVDDSVDSNPHEVGFIEHICNEQKISEWARSGHKFVIENSLSDGERPSENVTREEMWTMLYRLFNFVIKFFKNE